jgi:hypothetical protein
MSLKQRFCRVCGQPFRFVRFDSQVCTTTCGMRKIRGFDLAYLTELPPDQARARRSVHAAIDDEDRGAPKSAVDPVSGVCLERVHVYPLPSTGWRELGCNRDLRYSIEG